jgi:WXG100 family type VII secretion target
MATDPGHISITYAALAAGHQELLAHHAAAKTMVDDLRTALDQHLAEWSGDVRTAYEQVKQDWDQAFAGMAETLHRASTHLENTRDLYHQHEVASARIWSRS